MSFCDKPLNKRKIFVILLTCLVIYYVVLGFGDGDLKLKSLPDPPWPWSRLSYPMDLFPSDDPYLLNTSGCKIFNMKEFTPGSIANWMAAATKKCPRPYITLDEHQMLRYQFNHSTNVKCCYRTVTRISDNNVDAHSTCTAIPLNATKEGTKMSSEFIQIECQDDNDPDFNKVLDFQATVFPPQDHSNATKKKESVWKSAAADAQLPPSVLILGVDSISRLHLMRSLPKTREYILKQEFIELMGYTRVGDGTYPNVMAMLGDVNEGFTSPECQSKMHSRMDSCPLIWKNFSSQNYVTALIEDAPGIGIFNYLHGGFSEQPTDYYLRPLMFDFQQYNSGYDDCIDGGRPAEFLINYIKKFVRRMSLAHVPYFLFSWITTISHGGLNDAQTYDKLLLGTMKDFMENPNYNVLDESIIIFVSDHGHRVRPGFSLFYEANLPFCFIRLPSSFKSQHAEWSQNLRENSHRLTSPLDIYQTLVQILNLNKKPKGQGNPDEIKTNKSTYSLFEKIPENRTCENARIPDGYCNCGLTPPINISAELATFYANIALEHINLKVLELRECTRLSLSNVTSGLRITNNGINGSALAYDEFLVTFGVKPGTGVFNAKIRQAQNETRVLRYMRTTSYEGEADCMFSAGRKEICYCSNLLIALVE